MEKEVKRIIDEKNEEAKSTIRKSRKQARHKKEAGDELLR